MAGCSAPRLVILSMLGKVTPFAALFALVLFLGTPATLFAQNNKRDDLETKRKKLLEEIDKTNQNLSKTRQNKSQALKAVVDLQKQVNRREEVINTLQNEIELTEQSIERSNIVLQSLDGDVERLKQEYAQMMRVALRNKLDQSYLLFLFSASNLNEALRRWQYIRQYQRYRKRQAKLIVETLATLKVKSAEQAKRIKGKSNMLATAESQKVALATELTEKDQTLKTLKNDEKSLVKELKTQQDAHRKLNTVIEGIIQQEMAARRKKNRSAETVLPKNTNEGERNEAPKRITEAPPSPEEVAANGSFAARRGRLPWPVEQGTLVRGFGAYRHPKFKDVTLNNSGVDLKGNNNRVRAVHEGKVVGAQYIPGFDYTVIIQHGAYYTVYSQLSEIVVKRDEQVSARQDIGRVSAEKPEMHFEVWRDKQRLNPRSWIE
jgi:murein hydrolase activator